MSDATSSGGSGCNKTDSGGDEDVTGCYRNRMGDGRDGCNGLGPILWMASGLAGKPSRNYAEDAGTARGLGRSKSKTSESNDSDVFSLLLEEHYLQRR
nr:hypothetical protein [Brevibacillus sp. Leaf182]